MQMQRLIKKLKNMEMLGKKNNNLDLHKIKLLL